MRNRVVPLGPGAAAVVDALGFKEARKHHAVDDLVSTIKQVQATARSQASMAGLFGGLSPIVAAISDTVLMASGTQADDWSNRRRQVTLPSAIYSLCSCVAMMVVAAARSAAPLAYRGCVATGEIHAEDGIFLGTAIDEAAEHSEAAAAAVVWLTPAARGVVNSEPDLTRMGYVPWALPLRSGGSVDVLTVNPFLHEAIGRVTKPDGLDMDELDRIEQALLSPLTKSSRLDVAQKLQNTTAFLKEAKAHTIARFDQLEDDYYNAQSEAYSAYEGGNSDA
jgi:hypothetical protein